MEFSLETAERRDENDYWTRVSRADLLFLTSHRPNRISAAYSDALLGAPDFVASSVRRQVSIFEDLDLLSENRSAVIKVTGPPVETDNLVQSRQKKRVLLFTGHMIDLPSRMSPRFPPDEENVASEEIRRCIEREMKEGDGVSLGIAGGAPGGDLLFHEVCTKMNIPTELYLTLVPELYVSTTVRRAGNEWIQRFWQVYNERVSQRRVRVLSETEELPAWLQPKPNYSIWERSNLWMLCNALDAEGADAVTLIALWDGTTGEGPGGTSNLVETVHQLGGKYQVINTQSLFGLA